jgi:hypothetical protein
VGEMRGMTEPQVSTPSITVPRKGRGRPRDLAAALSAGGSTAGTIVRGQQVTRPGDRARRPRVATAAHDATHLRRMQALTVTVRDLWSTAH